MHSVQLPRTDLHVSRLCFGCWGIVSDFHWGQRDEHQALQTMHVALDAGINFFDTAAMYGAGASEQLLGQFLANRREQVVIASKVHVDCMRPEDLIRSCEQSLVRLGTDYIDLYQTHWTSREVPIEDSWQAMLRLREQGKARFVGACNLGPGDLARVIAIEPPVTNQLPYNLLWRMIEAEILPLCRAHEIGVLAYSPLMHGLLAGRYASADEVPEGRARSRHFRSDRGLARHGEAGCETETFAALEALRSLSRQTGRSMADLALAWCGQQPGVASVIAGASTPSQLAANVTALADPLPAETLHAMSAATSALAAALGTNADMWQGTNASRFR